MVGSTIECGRRFTTRERVDEVMPKVVKRDERREEFLREKLLAAVQKACQKRSDKELTHECRSSRADRLPHPDFFRAIHRPGGSQVHEINSSDQEQKETDGAQ